jgi:ArsR family transcriptional regulator
MDQLGERLDVEDTRLYADVLSALAEGPVPVDEIAESVEAPPPVVREALSELEANGIVTGEGEGWRLSD